MGQVLPDGERVVTDIIRDACHVFLNASMGEYVRRSSYYASDPVNSRLLQCAALAAGTRAFDVLRALHIPRRAGETVDPNMMRLTWEGYLKVGVHPVHARERGMPIVVRLSASSSGDPNELLGHPLNAAIMFAKFLDDQYSARLCVGAFHQLVGVLGAGIPHQNSLNRENLWDQECLYRRDDRYRQFGFWTDSWACPDPRKHGLGDALVEDKNAQIFMAYPLMSWYSEDTARDLARSKHWGGPSGIENMARAMQIAQLPHAPKVLGDAATECIKDRWEDIRPHYELLVTLLRLMPAAGAAEYLAKASGAKAVLNICLGRATRDQMTSGLSAMAQRGEWIRHLSSFYGRAPTVSELCGLRAKKLVDVLYYMPAAMLQEVLEEDSAAERLRARLLREVQTADPTMLRASLMLHDKRAALADYPLLGVPKPISIRNTKDNEWDAVYGQLAVRYSMATALRARLTELIPDELVRITAVLAIADAAQAQPILNVLRTMPNWEEAQTLITSFSALFDPLLAEEGA